MLDSEGRVIGVIQLLNARDPDTLEPAAFDAVHREMIEALACLAAVALENHGLLDAQRNLLESFIQVIATAIDAKSPYTGAHCARVPVLTELLTNAACEAREGPFAEFQLGTGASRGTHRRVAARLREGLDAAPCHGQGDQAPDHP